MISGAVRKVAIIGNHTPRQCGIATFTADVAKAVEGCDVETLVVAMNDKPEGYDYPEIVKFQVDQECLDSYRAAAKYLNSERVDVICVQHEYGIFGGVSGSHLLSMLREVNAPIVTTLHTILKEPNNDQRQVLSELSQLSERLIVMTQLGKSILEEVHSIDPLKITVVPHGIPSVSQEKPQAFLDKFGLVGKRIITTFGLIGPDKGIEDMVTAMPAIVRAHPDAHYLVVGATHPHIRAHSGESYRQRLIDLAESLGVSSNVSFVDRFVSTQDLTEYLQATSIYVTPYLKKQQITSGTLAYAFGSGNAVVSTPYWHAEELLADGKGILVPFRDPKALSDEITELLGDAERLQHLQARAYAAGRKMQWPVVGECYVDAFELAQEYSRSLLPDLTLAQIVSNDDTSINVDINLTHLLTMTDATGILQHSTYSIPNRFEGYCTDDNARLAIVGARLAEDPTQFKMGIQLQHTGLSFLHHAFNPTKGRMRNFMSYDRTWLEDVGSEDSHGRAMWALGVLADESTISGIRAIARDLFKQSMRATLEFTSPRSWAFAILGFDKILASSYCSECFQIMKELANRLNSLFLTYSSDDWCWFEHKLAYDNARLPQALFNAGHLLNDLDMISNATSALTWLLKVQTDQNGYFFPIGTNGFYEKGGKRAQYDQQPLEATATMEACLDVYVLTDLPQWQDEIRKAHAWFLGANTEYKSMIDEDTGGCKDGLMRGSVNHNQGAESTLAYLAAQLTYRQMRHVSIARQARYLG